VVLSEVTQQSTGIAQSLRTFGVPQSATACIESIFRVRWERDYIVYFVAIANFRPENLDRLASVTYDWWINPFASSIHVRCDGYDDEGREFCDSGKCTAPNSVVTAFTIKHQPHINFCPGYFTRKTLAEALMGGDWVEAGAYFNQGECNLPISRQDHELILASFCLGT
jgi:hypothetical protein